MGSSNQLFDGWNIDCSVFVVELEQYLFRGVERGLGRWVRVCSPRVGQFGDFRFHLFVSLKEAPEGAPFGLEFVPVKFSHSENHADEVSFVCVPIFCGDSALFSELRALGDELGVVGDGVD